MTRRWTERLRAEPFDLERVRSGEALVVVELPDGRRVVGRLLSADEMLVPTGERTEIPDTFEANSRRTAGHLQKVLAAGEMLRDRRTVSQTVAELTSQGLLDPDAIDPATQVKAWRREFRKLTG